MCKAIVLPKLQKMTPTEALEVAPWQTPLDLATIEAAGLTAYRLKCQGAWRDTGLLHKLDFLQKHAFTLNQDRILKKYQLAAPFKVWIPTRQDRQKPDKIIDPMWFVNSRMGQEFTTALVQALTDPYKITGKAYLWVAFPRCFLLK